MKIFSLKKKILSKAIRDKIDILKIVISVSEYLMIKAYVLCESIDENFEKDFLVIEKMNRLFIKEENKYYSIAYPFSVDNNGVISYRETNLTVSMLVTVEYLINCIKNDDIFDIERLLDLCWNFEQYNQMPDSDKKFTNELIIYLLHYEVGYIRFDIDEANENGKLHPKFHFDINYDTKSTFKIGLFKNISVDSFADLLNIKSECYYLKSS